MPDEPVFEEELLVVSVDDPLFPVFPEVPVDGGFISRVGGGVLIIGSLGTGDLPPGSLSPCVLPSRVGLVPPETGEL